MPSGFEATIISYGNIAPVPKRKRARMAVVYKCDGCGKEAKHGDEWLVVNIQQRSIRLAHHSGPEEGGMIEAGYYRGETLACNGACAVRLILKRAEEIKKMAASFFDDIDEDYKSVTKSNRG